MNCAQSEQLIDAYLDNELSGSLRLEFDAHRLRCRRCQLTLAMMESVGHVVASDTAVPKLSDEFADRVMLAIERRRPLSVRLRPTRVAVVAGALLQAAAVIYLAIILSPAGAPRSTPSGSGAISVPSTVIDPVELVGIRPGEEKSIRRERVFDYIFDRVESAGRNVATELTQLARYPLALSVSEDLGDSATPLHSILRALVPTELPTEEPASMGDGEHSL